ncbi:hypothetical protein WG922_05295 [Ramlibacter sp. AN1015]|uniref:hypothetical protein n=1 Tax=Ramlibacter sp. AN1015 TaxID=3133428 RepID=UPI0030C541E8
MTTGDPEPLLMKLLCLEGEKLPRDLCKEAKHFIDHGECGLAYDVIVYHVRIGNAALSARGLQYLVDAGTIMGVKYPDYCFN